MADSQVPTPKKKTPQVVGVLAAVVGGALGAGLVRSLEPQTAGMLVGGAVAGLLCGLLPLFAAKKKGREQLGNIALIACVVAGFTLGLILAIPTAVIFFAFIQTRKPPVASASQITDA